MSKTKNGYTRRLPAAAGREAVTVATRLILQGVDFRYQPNRDHFFVVAAKDQPQLDLAIQDAYA